MTHQVITSLHSPHVERVKALLGSRGKKLRREESLFIADGLQSLRSALDPQIKSAPRIENLYLTPSGEGKLRDEFSSEMIDVHEIIPVTDAVMAAMADTESPQGILALCRYRPLTLEDIVNGSPARLAFFWQIQDPGNAGTAIRTADACGFNAVLFSEGSVDLYSPKVVRSTAGSLWNIPVVEDLPLAAIVDLADSGAFSVLAFDGSGSRQLQEITPVKPTIAIFGNEARGLPSLPDSIEKVRIPMKGHAESLNVASAAAIALFHLGIAGSR